MRRTRQFRSVLAVVVYTLCSSCLFAQSAAKTVYLDQGWSPEEREAFYYTAQGSELIPYQWFLHLEVKGGKTLFRDDRHLDRLRYVTRAASKVWNPQGLPVGFVEDKVIDPTQTSSKVSFLKRKFNKKANADDKKTWLGLTCAACHTNVIEFGASRIQIDGAPAMSDLQSFLEELAAAVESTHSDADKMERFVKKLGIPNTPEAKAEFKAEFVSHSQALNELVKRNASQTRYGFARLDAFGAILNAVCDAGLDLDANRVEANAPVSYPFLWETPRMDWVQWNSISNVPLGRNVGEVLGVFGFFTLKNTNDKQHQFDSTVKLKALIGLENSLKKLKAPLWPEELLGKLDPQKVQQGRTLFAANCAGCHQVRKTDGTFETKQMGQEMRMTTVTVPVQVIGTDPQMISNLGKLVDPGVLKQLLAPPLNMSDKVPRPPLLSLTVSEVTKNRAQIEQVPIVVDPGVAAMQPPFGGTGYKARALEGIWA
ncbi:MAG: Cytochrome c, partial [Planctomycetaceae bacterium]|nr:Cytochrome c [Planctomycetaceae bacterium]